MPTATITVLAIAGLVAFTALVVDWFAIRALRRSRDHYRDLAIERMGIITDLAIENAVHRSSICVLRLQAIDAEATDAKKGGVN